MTARTPLLLSLFFPAFVHAGPARGPYLVNVSSASAEICRRPEGGAVECRGLSGLVPGTTFSYSIPGSSASWVGKTLPGPGQPVSCAAFGDSGKASASQYRVAELMRRLDPDFTVILGDIVYPKGKDKDYDARYFAPYKESLSRFGIFPVIGNHDYGNHSKAAKGERVFRADYFPIHRRPRYYSFDAGVAHLAAVDDNRFYDIGAAAPLDPESAQWKWLDADLAASKAPWKIVLLHVPIHSSSPHGDYPELKEWLEPLFARHGVDLVLQGHYHAYERSHPPGKAVYVTAGTGGAGFHPRWTQNQWTRKFMRAHGLAFIRADARRLVLEFHDEDGKIQDTLTLEKPDFTPAAGADRPRTRIRGAH